MNVRFDRKGCLVIKATTPIEQYALSMWRESHAKLTQKGNIKIHGEAICFDWSEDENSPFDKWGGKSE